MNRTRLEVGVLVLLYGLIFGHGLIHLSPLVTDGERVPFATLTPVFALFSLTHAVFMLGWRRAFTFFAVSAALSLGAELAGVSSGIIFGAYHYTDAIGPKILGQVPVVIPISWFMMVYPSYVIANLVFDGQPTGRGGRVARLVFVAFGGALIMTAWDLTLDPFMVDVPKAWVWEDGGPYFGVPFHNYAGWVMTTFIVLLTYYWMEARLPLRPLGRITKVVAAMPLVTYGFMSLGDVIIGYPEATRVISPFAMGLPLAAAVTRLAGWQAGPAPAERPGDK